MAKDPVHRCRVLQKRYEELAERREDAERFLGESVMDLFQEENRAAAYRVIGETERQRRVLVQKMHKLGCPAWGYQSPAERRRLERKRDRAGRKLPF